MAANEPLLLMKMMMLMMKMMTDDKNGLQLLSFLHPLSYEDDEGYARTLIWPDRRPKEVLLSSPF